MKHIYLNLKRFDVPTCFGGVNRLAPVQEWAEHIVRETAPTLNTYDPEEVEFAMFFPEAHLLNAVSANPEGSALQIGAQSVYRADTAIGGNFGAFTSNRPASAISALGCTAVMIGHCEERNDLMEVLSTAGVTGEAASAAVNTILNREVLAAQARGLKVVYCIGEKSEELEVFDRVLLTQLKVGLKDADLANVTVAYEPVWSIGPGRTPAGRDYITKIARFVKQEFHPVDVVYGGGLKTDNAEMLASIEEIDGGLIALTRFSGEIGFYPEEYLDIIRLYLGK